MSTNSSNKKNVLLVFGALAIVLVAVFVIWRPPSLRTEDASGAIGSVQKHHEPQIQPQDVVLGDEQAKQDQAIVFGDGLNDAAKLQSISAEFGAIAASRDNARVTAASKDLASHDEALQARYSKYAAAFVQAANRVASRSADAKLQSDVKELGTKLSEFDGVIVAGMRANAMTEMNARMGLIVVICNKLGMLSGSGLGTLGAVLQSRGPEAAARINEAADALESRQDAARMASISDELQSITAQSKLMAQTQNRCASKTLDAKELNSISADLAQNAIDLETRSLNNLATRMNNEAELGVKLAALDAQLNAKTANVNMAAMSANKNDNISAAAGRLNAALAGAKADYAARNAASITLAAQALQAHEAASRAASRSDANRAAYANVQAAMRGLASRPEINARLDSMLQGRFAAKSN